MIQNFKNGKRSLKKARTVPLSNQVVAKKSAKKMHESFTSNATDQGEVKALRKTSVNEGQSLKATTFSIS